MSQHAYRYILGALQDEENLVNSLPLLIPCIHGFDDNTTDAAVLGQMHTRISVLLQSKEIGVRWSGINITKAMLSRAHGKWNSLLGHGNTWLKLLLKIMERELNDIVLERVIVTIHTIFEMTQDKPALTRDITVPSLPTFLTHALTIIQRQIPASLQNSILHHLRLILLKHSTTFRPFAGKLQSYCLSQLSSSTLNRITQQLAAGAYASLYLCAPKNLSSEQWVNGIMTSIGNGHSSLTYILQPVVEGQLALPVPKSSDLMPFTSDYTSQVSLAIRRLDTQLLIVNSFLQQSTSLLVKVPVGQTVMLITRMLETSTTSGIKATTPQSTQIALINALTPLHIAGLEQVSLLCKVFGTTLYPHAHTLYRLVLDITSKSTHIGTTIAGYTALAALIETLGSVKNEFDEERLVKLSRTCISTLDALIADQATSITKTQINGQNTRKRKHGVAAGSDQITDSASFITLPDTDLVLASTKLLKVLLEQFAEHFNLNSRKRLDVTILQILATDAVTKLDSAIIAALLELIPVALLSPGLGQTASAFLSAACNILEKLLMHADATVSGRAREVAETLELFIHPRFPASRPRLRQEELDALDDTMQDEAEYANDDASTAKEVRLMPDIPQAEGANDQIAATDNEETIQLQVPQSETQPDIEESQNAAFQAPAEEVAAFKAPEHMVLPRTNTEDLRREREQQLPLPTPATEKLLAEQFKIETEDKEVDEDEDEEENEESPKRRRLSLSQIELPPGWEDESDTSEIPPLFDSDDEQIILDDEDEEPARIDGQN